MNEPEHFLKQKCETASILYSQMFPDNIDQFLHVSTSMSTMSMASLPAHDLVSE